MLTRLLCPSQTNPMQHAWPERCHSSSQAAITQHSILVSPSRDVRTGSTSTPAGCNPCRTDGHRRRRCSSASAGERADGCGRRRKSCGCRRGSGGGDGVGESRKLAGARRVFVDVLGLRLYMVVRTKREMTGMVFLMQYQNSVHQEHMAVFVILLYLSMPS